MENQPNEHTAQRTEGNHVLNAPQVSINLKEGIEQIRNEKPWKESDRNSITLFKSGSLRIVLIGLHANAELKTHTANGIISVHVIEGQLEFTTLSKTTTLQNGQLVVLQEKIPHSVLAIKETFFLLTLSMNAEAPAPRAASL